MRFAAVIALLMVTGCRPKTTDSGTITDINPRLVGGAALFGVGWGLGGFCPGPGVVSSTGLGIAALTFTGCMLLGMVVFHAADPARKTAGTKA